ncbi:hypothetical protein C804_01087 [Lachnospiraceae bacterium A4]|nr:hypothetical protein C804_01087 [Lachnospiraceae bacterium A4]
MNFSEKIDIENNIVKYAIKAKYNEELTDEEIMEVETLHDYVKKIKFSEIDFTANITMDSGTPAVTDAEESDTVVEVSLGKIAPKEYVLDENLHIEFSIDAGRISDAELNDILTTKPLVSQAKIAVFQAKLKEKIIEILEDIRKEDNDFEQETETIL